MNDKTILIIDDVADHITLLKDILLENDYNVRASTASSHAINSIWADKPDLIILDVNMPETDGYEMCSIIKSNKETSDVPVLFVSAMSNKVDKMRAYELGASDYIEKPFIPLEVLTKVDTYLRLSYYDGV